MIQDYDYLLKLVLVGNQAVGKSSIFARFNDKKFADTYLTTVGVDFRFQMMNIDGNHCKLQIWDTAGQERFRAITSAYYKGSHAIIVVYDLTDEGSFREIESFWLPEVKRYADPNAEIVLVGNKSDLDQVVNETEINEFTQKYQLKSYKISAKSGEGVDALFEGLCRRLIEKEGPKKRNKEVKLKQEKDDEEGQTKDAKCC